MSEDITRKIVGQSYFTDIADFHTKFQLEYLGPPRELEPDLGLFRLGFMVEELAEYAINAGYSNIALALNEIKDSIVERKRWMIKQNEGGRNEEKQFDSLIDLTYVALGTSYLHGYDFDEGWFRVHTANMKKVKVPSNLEGSERKSKFDVVKPRGWAPPDLSDLVKP